MEAVPGRLFYYYKDPYRKVPVFVSGEATRCVLWIGGQAESFFTISYFPQLAAALGGRWCFAQMELPSGHIGYGAQDHYAEAEDVDEVIAMLHTVHGMHEVALFATSTGVQVALQVLESGQHAHLVTRFLLHGVVCAPDSAFFTDAAVEARRAHVQSLMQAGRREDALAMAGHYDVVVTPARVASGGYLTLQEALWQPALRHDAQTCRQALRVVRVPTLILIASDAQYRPSQDALDTVRAAARASVSCAADDITVELFRDTCDELRRLLKADMDAHVHAITSFLNDADAKRDNAEAEAKAAAEEAERQKRVALSKMLCA